MVSPVLNFVELDTISNNECSGVYGPLVIVKSTVCAVGHPEHSTCNVSLVFFFYIFPELNGAFNALPGR